MTRAMLDAVLLLVALVAAGHAGFYLRGLVDEYRMRRVLVRINAEVNRAVSDAHRG